MEQLSQVKQYDNLNSFLINLASDEKLNVRESALKSLQNISVKFSCGKAIWELHQKLVSVLRR